MSELHERRLARQSFPQVELHARVDRVVLTANDEGYAGFDIVDHAGEERSRSAIGAHHDGIGHGRQLGLPRPRDLIAPFQCARRQQEAPIRALAVGLGFGALFGGHAQHAAVVDG